MKDKYIKPELETKPYAQFESVFADCSKNSTSDGCTARPGVWPPQGSYSSHNNLGGH